LIEIDIDKAVKGTKEFDLLNSALQPNTIYRLSDGRTFKTSKFGHVEELTFTPKLSQGTRDGRQTEVGKLGQDGDVGGHIQACSLGGSCDRFNLFPQDAKFNNTEYKRFENDLRKALARGDEVGPVTVKFVRSDPKNPRPDRLEVVYSINGEMMRKPFDNGK
jgi:filamentous hemagglutinin